MRIAFLLLLLMTPIWNASAMPVTKITTVRRWAGSLPDETKTEFIQGDRKRTEVRRTLTYSLWPGGPVILIQRPRAVSIVRCDLGQIFTLNLDNRTYSSMAYPRVLTKSERRGFAEKASKEPTRKPTISVEISTVDTGERKEIFGRTARHVITTRRDIPMEGSQRPLQEDVTDGWYVDFDESLSCDPKPRSGSFAYGFLTVSANGQPADVPELKLVGKPETGFALSTKMTSSQTESRSAGSNDKNTSVNEMEVTDISAGPLDPTLFEIPAGFAHVDRIDFSTSVPLWARWLPQAHAYWLRIKQSITHH